MDFDYPATQNHVSEERNAELHRCEDVRLAITKFAPR
jgi:hypothetical protein